MREYLTKNDLMEKGLTEYQAKKSIKQANQELRKEGKIVFKGKAPTYMLERVLGIRIAYVD
jgi:hypothetical protein